MNFTQSFRLALCLLLSLGQQVCRLIPGFFPALLPQTGGIVFRLLHHISGLLAGLLQQLRRLALCLLHLLNGFHGHSITFSFSDFRIRL